MPHAGLLRCGFLVLAVLAFAASQDDVDGQPVMMELDDEGTPAMVEIDADDEGPKYDSEVENEIEAANLTKEERLEVEKTLDDLLRRSNISAKKDRKTRKKATTTKTTTTTTTKSTTKAVADPYHKASLVQEAAAVGGDDIKPLSNEDITQTLKVEATLEDPEVQELGRQHDNLTNLVRLQAKIVSETSTNLTKSNEVQVLNRAEVDRLGSAYEKVHDEADRAEDAYKAHLVSLAIAKKKRDDLKNKTEEARKYLEEIAPQYHAAEYNLGILMSRSPWLQGHANTTGDEESKRGRDFSEVREKKKRLKAKISADDKKLQEALAKLNELNLELRKIEDRVNHKGSAFRASSVGLALLAALSSGAWSW